MFCIYRIRFTVVQMLLQRSEALPELFRGAWPRSDTDKPDIYRVDPTWLAAGRLKNLSAVFLGSGAPGGPVKRRATNHVGVNIRHNPESGSCSGQEAGRQRARFQDSLCKYSMGSSWFSPCFPKVRNQVSRPLFQHAWRARTSLFFLQ